MSVSPYDYLDFRAFLRDWFKDRKGRPSMRGLSADVGCSVSQLSRVMNATRDLSEPHAEALATRIGVSAAERAYFLDLVEYEQGLTLATRREALDRVMVVRRFREARRITDRTYALLSRWYYADIAELARCDGFRADPVWIAQQLVPSITPDQAAEAIEALLDLGLLVRDGESIVAADGIWTTEHEVGVLSSVAAAHQHRMMLDRAKDAIDGVPRAQRDLSTTTLPVSDALMTDIKLRIAQFQMEIMSLVAQDQRPRTHVVQLGVQLFPLSRPPDEAQ